jgi:hypothetical protein
VEREKRKKVGRVGRPIINRIKQVYAEYNGKMGDLSRFSVLISPVFVLAV